MMLYTCVRLQCMTTCMQLESLNDAVHLCMPSVYADLYATGEFESMSSQTDEAEHSIEMQLPYIAKVMERCVYMFKCVQVNMYTLVTTLQQTEYQVTLPYIRAN